MDTGNIKKSAPVGHASFVSVLFYQMLALSLGAI